MATRAKRSFLNLFEIGVALCLARPVLAGTANMTAPLPCETAEHQTSPPSKNAQNILITNPTGMNLKVFWVSFTGKRKAYGSIAPHGQRPMKTFSNHVWLLADEAGHCVAAFTAAPSSTRGRLLDHLQSSAPQAPSGSSNDDEGIQFVSSAGVSSQALTRARYVVRAMLSHQPQVRERMKAIGFKVEIIGKDQVLSDLPDYATLKGRKMKDGRNYDTETRGVGGRDKCSIGEENLLCLTQQPYPKEDILIHEFSHSIRFHVDPSVGAAIDQAYRNAMRHSLYPKNHYILRDAQEYWAEGTQAWFGATRRTDVNGGFNTKGSLKEHDPQLAAALEQVYGPARVEKVPGCPY